MAKAVIFLFLVIKSLSLDPDSRVVDPVPGRCETFWKGRISIRNNFT
jgi:hypothetical protein